MTWHSSSRGTPGGAFIDVGVLTGPQTVVVVPTVPVGRKRAICMGSEQTTAGQAFFDMLPPATTGIVVNGAEASVEADFEWFIVKADGTRFPIQDDSTTDSEAVLQQALAILDEGERLEVDLGIAVGAPDIHLHAQWLDPQGPLHLNQVALTDEYQDLIPAPPEGYAHVPLLGNIDPSLGGQPTMAYTIATAGSVGDALEATRAVNGVPGDELAVGSSSPGTFGGVSFAAFKQCQTAFHAGESLQMKLTTGAAGNYFCQLPYLRVLVND
jgi:hypothetical protein